jgi:hypothetical protein
MKNKNSNLNHFSLNTFSFCSLTTGSIGASPLRSQPPIPATTSSTSSTATTAEARSTSSPDDEGGIHRWVSAGPDRAFKLPGKQTSHQQQQHQQQT